MAPTRTVAIADDTAFVRDRFKAALESAGHRALTIRTGAELVACIRAELERIDLIVLDLRLPQARGAALVRGLRALNRTLPPIVVFSGTIASAEEVRELDALGVAGYVNEYAAVQHIVPSLAPYLFPATVTRRSSPRVTLGVSVSYRFGSTIASAVTLNVSAGGLAIRTTTPHAVGTMLKVRFRLPGAGDVETDARVVWTGRGIGMGVQFTEPTLHDQAIIDKFVSAHFFSNRKA